MMANLFLVMSMTILFEASAFTLSKVTPYQRGIFRTRGYSNHYHGEEHMNSYVLMSAGNAGEEYDGLADTNSDGNESSDTDLWTELNKRKDQLELGIGKRYVVRTTNGFLNVHSDPSDPFALDNIVDQLLDGDIVTSVGPNKGHWVRHDRGGWSISVYSGFVWLQPIDN